MKEIEQYVRAVVKRMWKTQSFTGKVIAVDKENDCCEVEKAEGLSYYQVRLNAIIDTLEAKITAYPKIGSFVICQLLNDSKTEAFVSKMSNVDELRISCEKITINGGENGGLTITPELKEQLAKNNAILSGLTTVINGAPVPEPGNNGPSAFQSALKTAITGKAVGNFENIENGKIRH